MVMISLTDRPGKGVREGSLLFNLTTTGRHDALSDSLPRDLEGCGRVFQGPPCIGHHRGLHYKLLFNP